MQAPLRTRLAALLSTVATLAALLVGGAATVLVGALATAATGAPASAAVSDGVVYGGPHDPFGRVRYVNAVPGGIELIGFAIDPDAPTRNIGVAAIIDGRTTAARGVTDVARPEVTSYYKAGPTPAFDLVVPVPAGNHAVCLAAQNIGPGVWSVLKCVAVPLGLVVSSGDLAKHSPYGAKTSAVARNGALTLSGWATDPDFVWRPTTVAVYLDGSPAATVVSGVNTTTLPANAGPQASWTATFPISAGAHLACVWLVNTGWGSNTSLGCVAFDTRGAVGTTPVVQPAINTAVLAEAVKHRGQQYVWGATGPKTFDCSGLVVYSYGLQKMALPRTSELQFAAARMIPASRVVPGDLVFTHDAQGDVYHVGIYVSPGLAFAAIDTAQGVNYQNIWDPVNTTYGSFTHI